MTRIDIFSGFLGAGKTTLIRKLIAEAYKGERLVLIENEFGEIAIDGGFLKDAGVEITEMNSGCICCTLVGDFEKALKKVMEEYAPDRIIIEPSGVGKLSDVARAVEQVEGAVIGAKVTVVDAGKCRMYMRNFGEFFNDQVENADIIVMSRTDTANESKILTASELLKKLNPNASLISTPWDKLDGMLIKQAMDGDALKKQMEQLEHEEHEHHHHHDHDHDEECSCGCHDHDHDDDDDHDEHEHHHHHDHDHDDECSCGCHDHDHDDDDDHDEHEHHHHHDHDHDDECSCGCHDHDHEHHHHHHADEVFTSWGVETPKKFDEASLHAMLDELADAEKYGTILRAKGFVDASDGEWIYFDYVPGEADIRRGNAAVTGRLCVIGSKLNEQALKELFGVE
jgi:G3E family GTPase